MSETLHAPIEGPLIDRAWHEAAEAAQASGVTIRNVETAAEAHEVSRLLAEIWPQANGASQIEANLVRALAYAGNYVSLAWADDGRAIGACVAFFGAPVERHVHSHIAGVTTPNGGRGIGRAMKLHQRAWCLERNVHDMSWTYDPLISRNAHFNLVRLGAQVTDYLPDFYGGMADERNGGQRSDRLVVTWPLNPSVAVTLDDAVGPALIQVVDGQPLALPGAIATMAEGNLASLPIPDEFERLRASDPAAAARWRDAVTDILSASVGSGRWRIAGFHRDTGYLLKRNP